MSADQEGREAASASIRCPFCEGEISPTAQKCRHCGEWVKRAAPAPPAPYVPPPPPAPPPAYREPGPVAARPHPAAAPIQAVVVPARPAAAPAQPAMAPYPMAGAQSHAVATVNVTMPESNTFAVVTLIFYLFIYPIGFLLNLVGLLTGPRRGCFLSLLLFFVVLPVALILIALHQGTTFGVSWLDELLRKLR